MKNSIKIFFVLLVAMGSISCLKNNPYPVYDPQPILEKEAPILKSYVEATEALEGAKLDTLTGIWYKIIKEGISSTEEGYYKYKVNNYGVEAPLVTVKYEGKLVSTGVVFDKNDKEGGIEWSLGNLIDGWKIAFLPKSLKDGEGKVYTMVELINLPGLTEQGLQQGAKIRLVIPSPFGYQDRAQQGIPADSPLDFTIEVLKIVSPVGGQ